MAHGAGDEAGWRSGPTLVARAVGALVLISAVSKLFSSEHGVVAVAALIGGGHSPELYRGTFVGTALVEAGVAMAVIVAPRSRACLLSMGGLLLTLTAALVMLRLRGSPVCGCSVRIASEAGLARVFWPALARNACLIAAIGFCLPSLRRPAHTHAPQSATGFTLVELLVVLVVMTLLLGLTLPALAGARSRALATRAVSDSRQLAACVLMYTDGAGGVFPFMATAGEPDRGLLVAGVTIPSGYFAQSAWWPTLLARSEVDPLLNATAIENIALRRGEMRLPPYAFATTHRMVLCAFTAPAYWIDPLPAPVPAGYFRPARVAEVATPSRKALLVQSTSGMKHERASRWVIARADGSALMTSDGPINTGKSLRREVGTGNPYMQTWGGMTGIDLP